MSAFPWKLLGLALLGGSFAPLTLADEPSEAKGAEQAALFKQLDVNGDGFISKDEVPADKKTLAERLFRNADKNEDGKLSTAEFANGLAKQPDPAPDRAPGAGPFGGDRGPMGMMGNADAMWKMMDRDGDGLVKTSDVPEERRERFGKMVEMADSNKDGALSKEEFQKFTARMAERGGFPGKDRPEGARPEASKRPESEGEKRPDGERRPEARPDGERKPEARPDGDRPTPRLPDGVRPFGRPEGRPEVRPEGRPEMRREGDRPEGRPEFAPGGPRGPGGAGLFFVLDTDRDGKLSKSELENAAKSLGKLDRNGDGELTPQELMPEGPRPEFRPEMRRPEGDRPAVREGDRPAGDRPTADRPAIRDGERRPEARGDGERRPEGPRDGEKPRQEDKPRDGEKPKN